MGRKSKPAKEPGVFGANLRRLLEQRELGATWLERETGIARSTWNSLMDGSSTEAKEAAIRAAADALNVPADMLMYDPKEHPDVEAVIAAYRKSGWASTLKPPFSEADTDLLRHEARFRFVGKATKLEAVHHLLLSLRAEREDPFGSPDRG